MSTLDYLRAVYGDSEGRAHIGVGTGPRLVDGKLKHEGWTQTHYAWPAEADQLVRALAQESAAGADAYVCPYLMHGTKRAKGAAVGRRLVHADVDGTLDPGAVEVLRGFAVTSGSEGHGHVYVPLDRPVSGVVHTALCRALGTFLGDADAKVTDNDLLRPPGTLNHKTDPPRPVEWLRPPTGHLWTPDDLATALGVTLPHPEAQTAPSAASVVVERVEVDRMPQRVREALASVTGDRSADTMRVVGACHDAGLTLAQTRGVVMARGDLAQRLAERTDDDVLTCWLKATDSRAQRRQADDWTAELSTVVDCDSAEVDAEPADDDRDAAGASWEPVDLADVVAGLLAGTVTRHAPTIGRRDDGAALFYAGKVNGLAGASGSGKTWTALAACAQQLEDGQHVAYIDLEDDGVGIVGRLLDLGVNPEQLAGPGRRFHYLHPEESFGLAAVEHLRRVLAEYAPALVVIDSTGESMALEGAKPNDDDDTARWFRKLPTPIARTGAAVLVLDHVVKAEDGGLWPIGSQRKRAAVSGAQYMQTTVRPFDKNTPGVAKLVCAKDRHGNYRPGQRVADLHVTPEHGAVTLDLRAPVEAPRGDRKWRPTALMERIAQALEDAGEALSFRSIDREVPGKADHLRTALRVLVEEGHVQVSEGPRNANLHTLVKPYAQRTDPDCELYAGEGHTRPSPDRVSVSVSLGRDTGHTHSTVSGTHSGHGGTHSPEEAVCRHLDCAEPARPGRVMCAMHFTREPARSA